MHLFVYLFPENVKLGEDVSVPEQTMASAENPASIQIFNDMTIYPHKVSFETWISRHG
jgi:hypothetical protein